MLRITLLFSLILFASSLTVKQPRNRIQLDSVATQTYVIIATNDIHGGAFPTQMVRSDTKEKYTYGGLVYLANMIDTIRQQYGSNNVLYLDAGDQYQGGIEASDQVSNGMIINQYFNTQNTDATAMGNHQFDNGPDFLYKYMTNNESPYLAANLYSETGLPVNQFLPNSKRSQMFTLNNGLKVGVIGLITQDTPFTSSGFTKHLFPDYKFLEFKDIVIAESAALKKRGATIIVGLAHQGNLCVNQSLDSRIWTPQTPQQPCADDVITKLIDNIPEGTIHAFVQGHKHQITHFFKNGIPVVGTNNGGYYFNLIYLTVDKAKKTLLNTSIQGPIPICQKIFSVLKRCNYVPPEQLSSVGNLTSWNFHEKTVTASLRLQSIFDEWLPKMAPFLVDLVENQVFLQMSKVGETQLGNMFGDLYLRAASSADFSLINPGSFRTSWVPGIIQQQHFFGMFPFKNLIQTFSINGYELKQMFQILQAGVKGFYIASGLQMTVTASPRSLVSLTFSNGTEILDDQEYTGVTSDFMLLGGDDMANIINKTYTPRNVVTVGELRDTLRPYLVEITTITSTSFIDPKHPRLVVI